VRASTIAPTAPYARAIEPTTMPIPPAHYPAPATTALPGTPLLPFIPGNVPATGPPIGAIPTTPTVPAPPTAATAPYPATPPSAPPPVRTSAVTETTILPRTDRQTQRKLLELDLLAARLEVEAAEVELAEVESIRKKNPSAVSDQEVRKRQLQIERA